MVRANTSLLSRKKHKKIIKSSKGYRGRAKSCFKIAIQRKLAGLRYSYVSRKIHNRSNRTFFVRKINCITKNYGIRYSEFLKLLKNFDIEFNRKQLAFLLSSEDILLLILSKIQSIYRVFNI